MNNIGDYQHAFDMLAPWEGNVPLGYLVDFLGIFTDIEFRPLSNLDPSTAGGKNVATSLPTIGDGGNAEGWFEAINWLKAAQEAQKRFVMISLGAHYGAQLVGAHRMLSLVNPMPSTLVAVEAEPENFAWISTHMRDNGIDPDDHWVIPMAISDSNNPVLFPVGSPGIGSNNCFGTNQPESRQIWADVVTRDGNAETALRNLFIRNTTGVVQPVHPGLPYSTEIKFVSAITLADILGPFDFVDFVEVDIQQSEIVALPPFIDVLGEKVRRIHIGTHGRDVHWSLHQLFAENGWDIVFSFEPNAQHDCSLGKFELNDGILTVTNPKFH